MSRRYLNDFKRSANGEYVYTGNVYLFGDYKDSGIKLGALCGLCFASVIGSGFINAAGLNNTFYVIIPYILEVACLFALCWNTVRLLWAKGELREYIYKPVTRGIPSSAMALSIFAGIGLICSIIFILINGFEKKEIWCIIYFILKIADFIFGILIFRLFKTFAFKQKEQSVNN